MIAANLRNAHQIRHALEVICREISVTLRPEFRQILVDFCPEFLLTISVPGQLPKSKGQLDNS